ncbi:hypothetical protein [Neobacillus kokaensis]|uniref:ParB/Sulfiredoxin domain-containing protein n=1 Tax=Neobacillus kokaensis TaxID=2759023 RepID=A0ABQ3N1S8_9BACI|nr:hypothetical protein [Neobacillus kokaensis]GHH98046.1 hypothetical protein AM1BK_15890 [Neobacillus kokaensis]
MSKKKSPLRIKLDHLAKGIANNDSIVELDPYTLLNHYRFDVPAKYIYAKFRELGLESSWGERLYDEHIRVFNGYHERDDSGKKGIDAFKNAFDSTLDSIKAIGFDEQKSIIPIGTNNGLIDGSHRLAASLLYGKKIKSVTLDVEHNYDYNCFRKKGLTDKWCDAIALEYCRLKKETYIAVVFPSAVGGDKEIKNILNEYGNIYYEKELYLTKQGSINLIKQLYLGEKWLGGWHNQFPGAKRKASSCFKHNGPIRVFVFETDRYENTRSAKEKIRSLFNIGNHSIHINDVHEETVRLAQTLFNENSIHFLNHSKLTNHSKSFYQNFNQLKKWLIEKKVDPEHFCIVSSSVMGVYGIRKPADLDFLVYGDDLLSNKNKKFSNHEKQLPYYEKTKDDIIFNPENHFYVEGIKFASLHVIKDMKQRRGESKDHVDLSLIDLFLGSSKNG